MMASDMAEKHVFTSYEIRAATDSGLVCGKQRKGEMMLGWLSKFKRKVDDKSEVKYAVKLDCGDKSLYLMPSEENSSRYGYKFTNKARFARHCTYNRALKFAKEWARCGFSAKVCKLRFFNLMSKVVTDVFPSERGE